MSSNVSAEALELLTGMGFSSASAARALRECGGNIEHAANLLLSQDVQANVSATVEGSEHGVSSSSMIHCPLSQYSVENGKSACTCIALTAAELFLQQQQRPSSSPSAWTKLGPEFLQNAILQGVERCNALSSGTRASPSAVEHTSAEDLLQTGMFAETLAQDGPVVQGMLGTGPLGLRALLLASQSPTQWTCALITKPPETVLCCLPPSAHGDQAKANAPHQQPFLLIDSHPRQQQFGAEGSYIRTHASLDDLVRSLETLFPPTNLGPDIPELMAAMYNQFDLYRLRLRHSST